MVYNWNKMVTITVPVGLNGWQTRGRVIINGREYTLPIGVETQVPEPVAAHINKLIKMEEEDKPELPESGCVDTVAREQITALTEELKGNGPHQMLVTGADGNTKWEDRTHYESSTMLLDKTTVKTEPNQDFGGMNVADVTKFSIAEGETYVVLFNGEVYELALNDLGAIGNLSIMGAGYENTGEPFLVVPVAGMLVTIEPMEATIAVAKPFIRQIDTKFIGDDVPKYGMIGELTRIEWDGNTDGLETMIYNAFNYYKVSDVVIPYEHVAHVAQTTNPQVSSQGIITVGDNCYQADAAIVVTKEGICKLNNMTINAPAVGVYFYKHDFTNGTRWIESVEIDTRRENSVLYLTNLSGVKYAITVDDSGTLTATEVTE